MGYRQWKYSAQETAVSVSPLLTGRVRDAQEQPVFDAHITATSGEAVLAEGMSQEDGRYTLLLVAGDTIPDHITIRVDAASFSRGGIRSQKPRHRRAYGKATCCTSPSSPWNGTLRPVFGLPHSFSWACWP